nr:MAG TPA: hypothetical protein [Caudoviricetes sp.]
MYLSPYTGSFICFVPLKRLSLDRLKKSRHTTPYPPIPRNGV